MKTARPAVMTKPTVITRSLLVASLFFASGLPAEEARRPLEIIERAIAFHGGERYENSETRLRICSRSGCFKVRSRVEGGLYDYEAEGKVGESSRRVRITNESVERWEGGEPVAVEPGDEQALRDWVMARVYFPFLPYRLGDPSVQQHDLGLERWAGRELHKVKVTFERGSSTDADDAYLYWFDPKTGRLEQFAYSFEGNPGGLRFRRAKNYRRVGGILFFDQENWGVEGEGLSVDQITPNFVDRKMRRVSEVELRGLEVQPLGGE